MAEPFNQQSGEGANLNSKRPNSHISVTKCSRTVEQEMGERVNPTAGRAGSNLRERISAATEKVTFFAMRWSRYGAEKCIGCHPFTEE
jgi:hypothetical protein